MRSFDGSAFVRGLGAFVVAGLLFGCSGGQEISREKAARNNQDMWNRIGRELAVAAARQSCDGRVLLVRDPEQSGLENGHTVMLAAFEREFASRAKGRPEVVTVETPLEKLPDVIGVDSVPKPKLTPAWLAGALAKNGPAVLIVSVAGEPANAARDAKVPPVVSFSRDGGTNLAAAIRSGAVLAAVAPRHTSPAANEQDWFELRYTVVTPENVGAW